MNDRADRPLIPTLRIDDFIAALGSAAPTPGAGAAGALALALAAGCAAKAFAISVKHTGSATLAAAADRARVIATVAVQGAQLDADDFRAWLAMPGGETDRALMQDANSLFELASALAELIRANEMDVIITMRPDVDAAVDLLEAFIAIERRNLETLGSDKDA